MPNSQQNSTKIEQGDIVYINFSPTRGHEQDGRRPALVISSNTYGHLMGSLVVVMPISNTSNQFPTHVPLATKDGKVTGAVLTQHLRTLDSIDRNMQVIDKATPETVARCKEIYHSFV
ncbi:type II toxin-antitoxin system PemK/MazF family toxin [Lysinibacillus fusiformis]|uniref:type II toxin-antitoxin system PemK/MazF family toxin n=1 Tax=Lysinibacillus fusiformis TaxID=28031 RepID=UPI0000F3631C|nr:type II toxin-antitoxin system PemK/MazF family toxin [Lysinibacillus fusiformis]EAZ83478.1 ppGpp-regulated growth inhibitor (ChpA/MazF) [Bacillus sp. B14905]MED4077563.1 type II toxin-antitoxin system PemK/MazF family toxin [Lysinibacillus fusiformis]